MNSSASETESSNCRSGMIALAGRPNVGKSTLLNCLLEKKISITSKKANTTRHRILGVLNEGQCQYVFIDLPGFNTKSKRLVDRSVHKTATSGITGTDLVLFVVECRGWHRQDQAVWNRIRSENLPCIAVISKIDYVKDKNLLLPVIQELSERTGIAEIVPVSAKKNENIDQLKFVIESNLPEGLPLFPPGVITDRDEIFQASESVREQVFRYYGDEIPYVSAVQIEKYETVNDVLHIDALIWVETSSQKKIIIGSGGAKIKRIGTEVRRVLESNLNTRVYLNLWVKVRSQWTEDQQLISYFGYSESD